MRFVQMGRRHPLPAVLTFLTLLAAAFLPGPTDAAGTDEPPGFSDPTRITNAWFPVSPGAVRVFAGREGGRKVTIVENQLEETRVFDWEGQTVECRIVEMLVFLGGALVERERRFYAQADDSTVWCFGETDDDEEGDIDEEDDPDEEDPGGWVVGQVAAGDPEDTIAGARPTVRMPAAPRPGDIWAIEEIPPAFDEVCEARSLDAATRTPAGRFVGCLRLRCESASDEEVKTMWFAPGIGLVRVLGDGERLRLQATTLRPAE